ncbi:MAG: hypothetical protein C0392_15805 [Syntrophus sp. (in: bacteria)]|nr:hypothetical protein [Syntrophus sp. (in: bacteria)]
MEIMSAKDLSRYLEINEKKIYKLVQESSIPSTRIGGKIAFFKELIDIWILENTALEQHIFIAGSDDVLLRSIINTYNSSSDKGIVFYAPVGSIKGLKLLKENGATMSCVHILDTEKKECNLSYMDRHLDGDNYVVIHLFMREQGIYLLKGNPMGIHSLEDISAKNASFINRNRGSGTRLLFDYLLHEHRIDPSNIKGYGREADSHLEVGSGILQGSADAGLGIRHVAHILGLDFISLFHESFDMVIPKEHFHSIQVKRLLTFFEQSALLHHIRDFTGYDTGKMGKVIYPRP